MLQRFIVSIRLQSWLEVARHFFLKFSFLIQRSASAREGRPGADHASNKGTEASVLAAANLRGMSQPRLLSKPCCPQVSLRFIKPLSAICIYHVQREIAQEPKVRTSSRQVQGLPLLSARLQQYAMPPMACIRAHHTLMHASARPVLLLSLSSCSLCLLLPVLPVLPGLRRGRKYVHSFHTGQSVPLTTAQKAQQLRLVLFPQIWSPLGR